MTWQHTATFINHYSPFVPVSTTVLNSAAAMALSPSIVFSIISTAESSFGCIFIAYGNRILIFVEKEHIFNLPLMKLRLKSDMLGMH